MESIIRLQELSENLCRAVDDLEDFFMNHALPMHQVDGDGIIVRVNHAELAFLGYEKHEYLNRPMAQFHHSQDAIQDILNKLTSGETIQNYQADLIAKNQSIQRVLITSSKAPNGLTRCLSIPVDCHKCANFINCSQEKEAMVYER